MPIFLVSFLLIYYYSVLLLIYFDDQTNRRLRFVTRFKQNFEWFTLIKRSFLEFYFFLSRSMIRRSVIAKKREERKKKKQKRSIKEDQRYLVHSKKDTRNCIITRAPWFCRRCGEITTVSKHDRSLSNLFNLLNKCVTAVPTIEHFK